MNTAKIGQFIAALRKSKGLTQREVAERLGITDKTVSKWECGNGLPDIGAIPAIAELFEVTADEILRGERIIESKQSEQNQKKNLDQIAFFVMNKCKRMRALLFAALALTASAFIALYTLLNITHSGPKSCGVSLILCVMSAALWLFAHYEIKEMLQDEIIMQHHDKISFSQINRIWILFCAILFLMLYVALLSLSLLIHSIYIYGNGILPEIARNNLLHQIIALSGAGLGLWLYSKASKIQTIKNEEE